MADLVIPILAWLVRLRAHVDLAARVVFLVAVHADLAHHADLAESAHRADHVDHVVHLVVYVALVVHCVDPVVQSVALVNRVGRRVAGVVDGIPARWGQDQEPWTMFDQADVLRPTDATTEAKAARCECQGVNVKRVHLSGLAKPKISNGQLTAYCAAIICSENKTTNDTTYYYLVNLLFP